MRQDKMTETESDSTPPPKPPIPVAVVHPKRRASLPLVWIVPLIAALIGGWIAVRAVLDRGPTIAIQFQTAEGLEAGKTRILYRNVDVGQVRTISLAADHKTVWLTAEMVKDAAPLLVQDTRFWVVRPRIAVGGVSGLGTLLSGSYIGMDIGQSPKEAREFRGLEVPPVVTGDVPGREFVLRGSTIGSVEAGSPVYFRHVPVGRVTQARLDPNGSAVTVGVFVESPYDRFVVRDTRFWHASGFDVSLGAEGVRVNTESLAAVLAGAIAFETPAESTESSPAPAETEFRLADTKGAAMKSPNEKPELFVLYFKNALRGLVVGAPVDMNGVEVGEVRSIQIEYDPSHENYRFPVEVAVYPERVRARYKAGAPRPDTQGTGTYRFVERLIEHGFRGQLRVGSLLTGQQYVALDFFPRAAPARSDPSATPMEIPTVSGGIDELEASLADILKKVDALPIDRIGADTDGTLNALKATLEATNRLADRLHDITPEIDKTLSEARRALAAVDQTLSVDAPLAQDLHQSLKQMTRAADALRSLADYLDRHPEALLQGKAKDGL
jgi:paraquat-inducible protein B